MNVPGGKEFGRRSRWIMLIVTCLWLSAAGLFDRAQACSQCMCGTPFPASVLGGVVPMQFTYGIEERYLSKTSALDEGPGVEREREHRVAGFVMWRPLNRLAVLGRLPYNFKQVTDVVGPAPPNTQTSRGVGDAELTLLMGVARTASRHAMTLGVVLGATAPSGSSRRPATRRATSPCCCASPTAARRCSSATPSTRCAACARSAFRC